MSSSDNSERPCDQRGGQLCRQLFERFRRDRDPLALAELFDRTAPELLRVGQRVALDAAEAEDLVQATFVTAIEAAERYDNTRPLVPWLIGILLNHARHAARRRARAIGPAAPEQARSPDPVATAEHREMFAEVGRALDRLPMRYRRVLLLNLRHGMQPKEIARALGCPAPTVRTRLRRGLAMLRKLLPFGAAALAGGVGLARVRADVLRRGARPRRLPLWASSTLATAAVVLLASVLALGGGAKSSRASGRSDATRKPDTALFAQTSPSVRSVQDVSHSPHNTPTKKRAVAHSQKAVLVHCVDPSGRPVAAVAVCLQEMERLSPGYNQRCAVTGTDGDAFFSGITPGELKLTTDRGNEQSAQLRSEQTGPLEATLTISAGARIAGRVVDRNGRVVAGARIRLRDYEGSIAGLPVATTGRQGTFTLDHVAEGSWITAYATGHASSHGYRVETAGHGEPTLALRGPAGIIRGRVLDPRGRPVARAIVCAGTSHGDIGEDQLGPESVPAVLTYTDKDGAFEFNSLPPVPLRVEARIDGFVLWTGVVSLKADKPTIVTAHLKRGAYVEGTVRTASGEPALGAGVLVANYANFYDFWIRTEADGHYRIGPLPPGRTNLLVFAAARGRAEATVNVPRRGSVRVDLALVRADKIHGVIFDEFGHRRTGRTVELRLKGDHEDARRRTVTDQTGHFTFLGCAPREHELQIVTSKGKLAGVLCCEGPLFPSHGRSTFVAYDE